MRDTAQLPPARPELSLTISTTHCLSPPSPALENTGEVKTPTKTLTIHSTLNCHLCLCPLCLQATSHHPGLSRHPCWPHPRHPHKEPALLPLGLNPVASSIPLQKCRSHTRQGGLQSFSHSNAAPHPAAALVTSDLHPPSSFSPRPTPLCH